MRHVPTRARMGAAAALLLLAAAAGAQPTIDAVVLFGGPGDQYAHGIAEGGGGIYATGWDAASTEGLFLKCEPPMTAPAWSRSTGYYRGAVGLTLMGADAFLAGWARPPYCGASDGAGDTEGKPALYLYDDAGNFSSCSSANFFPYRGGEGYYAALGEPGGDLFAAGYGEERGWGGFRSILAGYQADGTLLWKRRYATDFSGNHLGGTSTRIGSWTLDLAWLDGFLYLAGWDREGSHVGGPPRRAMLLKVDALAQAADLPGAYATNLNPAWSRLAAVGSMYRGATAFDGHVYAGGSTYVPGDCASEDPLVVKYNAAGDLIWSSNPAADGAVGVADLVAVGASLYAVGTADLLCDGDPDVWVAEIDPGDGSMASPVFWGGDLYDRAVGAASDGERLFVLGETRSFTEDGNAPGEMDLFLLELSVAPPDADGDGVLDDDDLCPATAAGEVVDGDGCAIAQHCPCEPEEPWRNHGAYVACVAHAAEDFVALGLITEDDKDEIVSQAARSSCGKKK